MVSDSTNSRWWTIGLWVAQILLAVAFGGAGFMKVTTPVDALAAGGMGWAADSPSWLPMFIGIVEILGALGMILPAATRIMPLLTPLAALGFAVIQILAIIVHTTRGEIGMTWPINLILLALSLFVLWGRWKKAPIASRRT